MTTAVLTPDDENEGSEQERQNGTMQDAAPGTSTPATSSASWSSIVRVSKEQGIGYSTLYDKVKAAYHHKFPWVRREADPQIAGRFRWSINVQSHACQAHLAAWRQGLAAPTSAAHKSASVALQCRPTSTLPSSGACAACAECAAQVQQVLPALCAWLSQHGLMIFQDALALQQSWCWMWHGVVSKGHATFADALTAALQDRLTKLQKFEQEYAQAEALVASWDHDDLSRFLDECDAASSAQDAPPPAEEQNPATASQETKQSKAARSFWSGWSSRFH